MWRIFVELIVDDQALCQEWCEIMTGTRSPIVTLQPGLDKRKPQSQENKDRTVQRFNSWGMTNKARLRKSMLEEKKKKKMIKTKRRIIL